MGDIQKDFIQTLKNLAPEGIEPRVKAAWANTGVIYYQNGDYQTVLAVSYNFQDGYATFNLSEITDVERDAIGARGLATRPQDLTWLGWSADYGSGGLKTVRDGVKHLLDTRCSAEGS